MLSLVHFVAATAVVCSAFCWDAAVAQEDEHDAGTVDHLEQCDPIDEGVARCLSGGTCFKIFLQDGKTDIGCRCTADFEGKRCAQHIPPKFYADDWRHYASPGWSHEFPRYISRRDRVLAGSMAALLVVQIVAGAITVFAIRRRNRRKAQEDKEPISQCEDKTPQPE